MSDFAVDLKITCVDFLFKIWRQCGKG